MTVALLLVLSSLAAFSLVVHWTLTNMLPAWRRSVDDACDAVYASTATFAPLMVHDFLSPAECELIVAESTGHAARNGGWLTDRHVDYPTTDLDTASIPSLRGFVRNIARTRIFPIIERAYSLPRHSLGTNEIFVAKYEVGSQTRLEQHTDDSEFSFVVALNDDFEGGGTLFEKKRLARPRAGTLTIFSGQTRHEGLAVTSGTRFILTGFLHLKCSAEFRRRKSNDD